MLSIVRKTFIFGLIILFSILPDLYSFEENLIIGREDAWRSLVLLDGVELRPGWEGYPDIVLSDGEYSRNAGSRDLLLHFNNSDEQDLDNVYSLENNNRNFSKNEKIFGEASLAFQAGEPPLVIHPESPGLLARGTHPEDFSIEFWLYPARLSEGEEILSWEGGWWDQGDFLPQHINCMVADQKLLWDFSNFFIPAGGANTEFLLQGDTILLPRRWHHHLIRYNSLTGLLEYLIDGEPEAMVYSTPTMHEDSEIYLPVCGSLADTRIQVGQGFIGLMDEMRISSSWVENPQQEKYQRQLGSAVTQIFDLGQSETGIIDIKVKEFTPGNSDVSMFFRISETLFSPDDPNLLWQEFSRKAEFPDGVNGRYIQLMAGLLPDGTGALSPSVSSIEISYQLKLPPLPPAYVIAQPGNSEVLLKWNAMNNSENLGFKIYYGEKPGYYFGTSSGSSGGDSPLDVGNVTEYRINGLENGHIYYFVIQAYTGSQKDLISEFSREVSARPSKLHRIEP